MLKRLSGKHDARSAPLRTLLKWHSLSPPLFQSVTVVLKLNFLNNLNLAFEIASLISFIGALKGFNSKGWQSDPNYKTMF